MDNYLQNNSAQQNTAKHKHSNTPQKYVCCPIAMNTENNPLCNICNMQKIKNAYFTSAYNKSSSREPPDLHVSQSEHL